MIFKSMRKGLSSFAINSEPQLVKALRSPVLVFLALLIPGISSANPQLLRVESGVYEGVTPCIGGSSGLYEVKMRVVAQGDGGLLYSTYETDPFTNRKRFKDHKLYISRDTRSRQTVYRFSDAKGRNSRLMRFIKGPTTTYLWTGRPNLFSGKCVEAILVKHDEELFPSLKSRADLCYNVSTWARNATNVRYEIQQFTSRTNIPGYNANLALMGSQFSDTTFKRYFGRAFSTFSDFEIKKLVYQIRDCARYSDRARQIPERLDWLFGRTQIERWQQRYPLAISMNVSRSYHSLYRFEEEIPSTFLGQLLALLRQVRDSTGNSEEIDNALNDLFLQPESPELEKAITDFLRTHTKDLVFLEIKHASEILNAVAARREMLRASRALAARFRLSEYPKLPPPDPATGALLPDDQLLRPLTESEIIELERSIEQDF